MFLLDLDPNVVKPGWTPLIITILLAAALVFLYISMRRQFRRINVNLIEDEVDAGAEGNGGPEGSAGAAEDDEEPVSVDDAAEPQAELDGPMGSDAPPPRTN